MPKPEEVRDQIQEVVEANGLPNGVIEADGVLMVAAPGVGDTDRSALVGVRCAGVKDGSVLVFLFSPVLSELPVDDEEVVVKATILMNFLNKNAPIGRWVFYDDERQISLEYEMLGDDLSAPEIIAAITSIGHLADEQDDFLKEELGGERALEPDPTNWA